ncbi:chemotaxis protein CheB [Nodularia harveyana UHCC-0300]|uniref:histidine kinase n=1 Tax=Nodularia harveyana UHCC-0300 TaxID=2974287 RepID=A0ABU5UFS6_9CYAN|nr:chemotaxis protein CheB [Nodularia harveyana]MEA5582386.1 chemotaxis protein CheB [Nodularia harveyana UHCC-0300]
MNSQSNSSDGKVSQNELFPIVGMGASAGGLEAFRELLSHLPIDTGMAFVIIQHLSPNQKSLLTEILSRTTQMPVVEVEDGIVVEPNHVYVIPPNRMMNISQGILQLSPREKTHGFSMTVDTFFISLAEERGNKAIGVVLSGGDSDGTRGLESIKAAGGITFAQCEASAKVNSMPNTAVASGYVDFILTPQQIAAELANISQHPYVNHPTSVKPIDIIPEGTDSLSIIYTLLLNATKVDFSHYKNTTLKRRIQRRMMLSKLDRLEDYVSYLQDNPAQIKALYQDLLITVTSFFRDPEAFEALKTEIFPIITKNRTPNSPIRIWVAGCSTGEEAYSIAICLLEFLTNQVTNIPIQIFATDINESAIEQARNGIYKINQVVNISPERLQRFFVPVEGGYQISKPVRELCVFARQNLIGDPPFSRLDLITCRNVLIYLGSAVQKKLLPIFHYGLNANGFLMLGTSETVGEFPDLFALVDRKNKIYSRKITATRLGMDLITNNYPLETVNTQPPVSADTWSDVELYKAADLIVLNDYAPVGVIINEDWEILQFRGYTSPYLQPPLGRPNFNLLKMAKDELRLELRTTIHQAKNKQVPVSKSGIQMRDNQQVRQVKIDVVPFKPPAARECYFLVLFASSSPTPILEAVSPPGQSKRRKPNEQEQEIKRLKQELAANKEYLQSIIEEQQATNEDLRAANEEILSSNEELQSTNEELETAKEEIQATNEELNTINDELQRRNIQSNEVTNDLQNLLSSINIPILMLGGNLQIRRYTPVAEKIFNLISSDMGRPISDINHNLNIPDLEKQILDVIGTLNFKTQELQDKNGRWYDLRIRPYRTIDNKIDGAVVILVDIDDLKRSSDLIRTSRDYVQAIVDTMRESLVVLDVNLRVMSANQFFYDTFQVLPAETEQRLVYEIGNGQWNIPQLRSLLEEILPYENQFQGLEVEHNFEQIGQKIMRLNARKMTLTDNREMILLVIEDITQQKQLEAERTHLLGQEQSARNAAEAANRAKDEFLSILSHELRNPLNSMLGWSNLLQRKQFDQETISQGLAAIERSAQAQAHLITDLLDISRISAGRLRMDTQQIDLVSVIESAIEVVRFSAEAKNIQIVRQLTPAPTSMVGDGNRLQQVFWNLLSNAIKFTPVGGKVTITLNYTDFQAQILVSDTGHGITADFLPYVFERFRQADGSRTRSNPGLGLGLSIVRYLVELHGGTIAAESQGEGQGATFTVRLPLQSPKQQISSPTFTEPAACINQPELPMDEIPSLEGVRVLVVDDQAEIIQLFKKVLEQSGAEMTGVESAKEALATLIANPGGYDALLSDIGLPEEDGYSLIRQVRELSPEAGGKIPAAALTAYAEYADHTEALAAGFQMHFAKPISPAQLLSIVATLAGRLK